MAKAKRSYYVAEGNTYTAFETEGEAREYAVAVVGARLYAAPSVRAILHHRRGCPGGCSAGCAAVLRLA